MEIKEEYEAYFGVDSAPEDIERLKFLSEELIKSMITAPVPTESDYGYANYKKAVLEQINFFDTNRELLESMSDGNYTIGKFSMNTNEKSDINEQWKRISPNTYSILLNIGLLYAGGIYREV
jgi:hypothetical protein